jgi:hypothetical protein
VTTFRYRYVALGLLLLAVVPRQKIVWPARFPIDTDRRFVIAGAVLILALGSARGLAVHDDIRRSADVQTAGLRTTRGETLVIQLGPSVVPDRRVLPIEFGWLRAAELRALFADYGNPFPSGRAAADEQLVDMGNVRSDPAGPRRVTCTPLTRPFTFARTKARRFVYLWSPSAPFTVDVRRFGNHWVRVDEGKPGVALRLTLPGLGSDTPWRVRANGACRVGSAAP